ncbi:MAG: hypothetical protein ACRELX_06015, partial [Longimicrobiales bacterium]
AGEQPEHVPILLALDADIVSLAGDSLRALRAGEAILWVSPLVARDALPREPIRIIVASR